MLESIYLFLSALAMLLMIIGLAIGNKYPMYSLLASILMGALATLSANVQVPFCDATITQTNATVANITQYTSSWSCTVYRQTGDISGLIWFWGGLGAVIFFIFIVDAFGFSFGQNFRRR